MGKGRECEFGDGRGLVLIAGPCVIESEELCLEVGRKALDCAREPGDSLYIQGIVRQGQPHLGGFFQRAGAGKGPGDSGFGKI